MRIPETELKMLENWLGDQDTEVMLPILEVFWGNRADKDDVSADLRVQYVLRDGIDVLRGQVWKQIDASFGDAKLTLSQKLENLDALRKSCEAEIETIESRAKGNRQGAIGQIAQTAPQFPYQGRAYGRRNPNNPGYAGNPVINLGVPSDVNF